jgi:protein-S-isoprenylcysteine O-methyltransferase Ste14
MTQPQTVHHILAKSYLAHFVASMIGLFIDAFIAAPFDVGYARPLAIIFMGLGPLLMLWAQYTTWQCQRGAHSHSAQFFRHGPYRFVRNPTHLGILILVTGYTLISGSLVFFGTTLLGFLISNIFFGKYENFNHESFGEEYNQYKARTPKI